MMTTQSSNTTVVNNPARTIRFIFLCEERIEDRPTNDKRSNTKGKRFIIFFRVRLAIKHTITPPKSCFLQCHCKNSRSFIAITL